MLRVYSADSKNVTGFLMTEIMVGPQNHGCGLRLRETDVEGVGNWTVF